MTDLYDEIYEDWHKKCKEFMIFFDGYSHNASYPMHKLRKLFAELEEMVFGEAKTQSWSWS